MTALQWETLFSKVVNTLDNLPIANGNATATGNLGSEIITANRIKLGRTNFRSLGGEGISVDVSTFQWDKKVLLLLQPHFSGSTLDLGVI